VHWFELDDDRVQWFDFVNTVLNLMVWFYLLFENINIRNF